VRLCFSDPAISFTTDMTGFKEQRICIIFFFNFKINAAETNRSYRKPSEIIP